MIIKAIDAPDIAEEGHPLVMKRIIHRDQHSQDISVTWVKIWGHHKKMACDISDRAYYIINQHINHTNICVAGCKFCAFYRARKQEGAYVLSAEDVERRMLAGSLDEFLGLESAADLDGWLGRGGHAASDVGRFVTAALAFGLPDAGQAVVGSHREPSSVGRERDAGPRIVLSFGPGASGRIDLPDSKTLVAPGRQMGSVPVEHLQRGRVGCDVAHPDRRHEPALRRLVDVDLGAHHDGDPGAVGAGGGPRHARDVDRT